MSNHDLGHKVAVIIKRVVRNIISGEGRVVGFPLYRYLVLFSLFSGVIQLVLRRAPESLNDVTPNWYTVTIVVVQMIGSLLVLTAILVMEDTPDAAQLERVGAAVLATVGFVQMAALMGYYDRIPVAQSSWMAFAFSLFCLVRAFQITKELRLNRAILSQEEAEERGEVD